MLHMVCSTPGSVATKIEPLLYALRRPWGETENNSTTDSTVRERRAAALPSHVSSSRQEAATYPKASVCADL
ncbi:hypothetical protein PI124_g11463 [Phytophthora idaei]|nr:hypothetical protein PI125_g10970 [Phytophthora idaei]KAG3152907.1 hypothetical protein PI126_g10296 [Phytophthora idaei]KAG3243711.1 hypothetical protein PI124_g11463 [Phytophthora idaei]